MNKITPRGPLGLKADKPTRQEIMAGKRMRWRAN